MNQNFYLFLDFDGVLHADGEHAIGCDGALINNPELFKWIYVLNEILKDHPDVKIIVSSDWRLLFDDECLIQLLGPLGVRFSGVVGCRNSNRYMEILQDAASRGIADWIAIDDHLTIYENTNLDSRLIWCDPMYGISSKKTQDLLRSKLNE